MAEYKAKHRAAKDAPSSSDPFYRPQHLARREQTVHVGNGRTITER